MFVFKKDFAPPITSRRTALANLNDLIRAILIIVIFTLAEMATMLLYIGGES